MVIQWQNIHTIKYYSAVKRNKLLIHVTTWIHLQRITPNGKKSNPKGYIMYDAIYVKILEFQNYRKEEVIHCQGLSKEWRGQGVGVIMKGWHEESCIDGNILYPDY